MAHMSLSKILRVTPCNHKGHVVPNSPTRYVCTMCGKAFIFPTSEEERKLFDKDSNVFLYKNIDSLVTDITPLLSLRFIKS